jgi:hypothetical protein
VRGPPRRWSVLVALALVGVGASILPVAAPWAERKVEGRVPQFRVDPEWPKPLPNGWLMGQAAGVTVDAQDHVWVIQRPHTLGAKARGTTLDPPRSPCCVPAPPVLEFDAAGNLLQAWGGSGQGYDWPAVEHGIFVDGSFVKEFVVAPATRGNGSVWDVDVSHDPSQTWLYNADGENNHVWTLVRESGRVLAKFGWSERQAGQFRWVHNLAVDSRGNIYTTEVDIGKRAQKFVFEGTVEVAE